MKFLFSFSGASTAARVGQLGLRLGLLAGSLGLGATTLSGCCWEACIGQDSKMGSVAFQVSADTLTGAGFTQQQAWHTVIVGYADEQFTQPTDSTTLSSGPRGLGLYFASGNVRRLELLENSDSPGASRAYRVRIGGQHFDLAHIRLETDVEKPCNCLYVKNMLFTLNGTETAVAQFPSTPAATVLHK